MAKKIKTLKDFILECVKLPGEEYDIFENECTAALVGQIYDLADPFGPEPFRASMHVIGFTNY